MASSFSSPHPEWDDPPSYTEATDPNNAIFAGTTFIYSIPSSTAFATSTASTINTNRHRNRHASRYGTLGGAGGGGYRIGTEAITAKFPTSFYLYYDTSSSGSRRRYFIGESQEHPLYAVSMHSALSSHPDLVLHSGATEDTPRIAAIDHESFSRSAMIALPPRPGSRFAVANERLESAGAFTNVMNFSIETIPPPSSSTSASTSSPSYSSRSIPMPMPMPIPRREHFEWRHSSGAEVEALGGRHSGWKLVRMSKMVPPPQAVLGDSWDLLDHSHNRRSSVSSSLGAGQGISDSLTAGGVGGGRGRKRNHRHSYSYNTHTLHRHRRHHRHAMSFSNSSGSTNFSPITEVGTGPATGSGTGPGSTASSISRSSDGREVVAVFAGAGSSISMSKSMSISISSMSNNNTNKSKALRFRFLGTGADGSLGDRWAIMTVATALAIWNRDRRPSSANSADHSVI